MATLPAHIAGLPVEEMIGQLAPAGIAILVTLRAARHRMPGSRTVTEWISAFIYR